MLEELKEQVCSANQELKNRGVVIYTWGNVSGFDRNRGAVVIKPSGIEYEKMKPEDMVVLDLETGQVLEGKYQPSSDTPTHLKLYRAFPSLGGIAHTHSTNAVSFAQAGMAIPTLGTTHADYFYGDIPCTRELSEQEVQEDYEGNIGKVIVDHIKNAGYDPMEIPGILVRNHGPFTWGKDVEESVYHAVVLEEVATMAMRTLMLNPEADMKSYMLEKHYRRKHGPHAYYGQNSAKQRTNLN